MIWSFIYGWLVGIKGSILVPWTDMFFLSPFSISFFHVWVVQLIYVVCHFGDRSNLLDLIVIAPTLPLPIITERGLSYDLGLGVCRGHDPAMWDPHIWLGSVLIFHSCEDPVRMLINHEMMITLPEIHPRSSGRKTWRSQVDGQSTLGNGIEYDII